MTLNSSNPRAKPRWVLLLIAVAISTLTVGSVVQAVLPPSTFEGGDGNLAPGASTIDWNSFSTGVGAISALGTAAQFTVTPDATGNSDPSIFTKSTKNHSVECPNVGSGSMGGGGNKDDLARTYLARQVVGGETFLYLAWIRVYPQNSTTAAANISFEFNQSDTTCAQAGFTGSRASALKIRTPGDLLLLYDFTGGSTAQGSGNPSIRISKWLGTSTAGVCEVGNDVKPCWGTLTTDLTSGPDPAAEARVNDASIGPVFDQWSGDSLGTVAFGEAAINLSDPAVGIFTSSGGTPTQCVNFGTAVGISRSSGNSITSALSDLAGPTGFTLSNCATVVIRKATSPAQSPATTSFSFSSTLTRLPDPASSPTCTTPNCSFSLKHGENINWTNVAPGTGLRVTEADPSPLYALTSITCTSGSTATNIETSFDSGSTLPARTLEFDLASGQSIDCTFTNTRQQLAPGLTTAPWVYPNDKATLTANAAFSDITGTVKFRMFDTQANCTATTPSDTVGVDGLLYKEERTLSSTTGTTKTVNTTNGESASTAVKVETSTTVWWLVEYGGDTNHLAKTSNCIEKIAVTLTNDP